MVYEYANHLSSRGHQVSVVHAASDLKAPRNESIHRRAVRRVEKTLNSMTGQKGVGWHTINKKVAMLHVPTLDEKYIPEADAVFATAWQTAEQVAQYASSRGNKYYLVMDFAPWIASRQTLESTWQLPLDKITISSWLYDNVSRADSMGGKLVNIPIGIDLNVFRLASDIRQRRPRIAMFYSSAPSKDSLSGLAAIENCKTTYPDLEAVFFGANSRLRPKGLPKWIAYRGCVSQQGLVEIYNSSRIYVCSSIAEGFALPPAEAMACGCAVVSTDCGGNREYASQGVNALLSPAGDPNALADNIRQLLANDDLRLRLAESGRQNIQNFNWERSTDRLEEFLAGN